MPAPLRRILVVDDEPEVAGTLRDYLADDGYDADIALNGHDALALFERKRPDTVLLDIAMPGMDGVEVLRRIKAMDATIPVIMATANADETRVARDAKDGRVRLRREALRVRAPLASGRRCPGARVRRRRPEARVTPGAANAPRLSRARSQRRQSPGNGTRPHTYA